MLWNTQINTKFDYQGRYHTQAVTTVEYIPNFFSFPFVVFIFLFSVLSQPSKSTSPSDHLVLSCDFYLILLLQTIFPPVIYVY
ncbi:hypothetical protein K449DRAFT_15949 [Hypoxylon sp. EC38]|nr:hypothetical protein K449DRAFT_15949 [Hypoxylon sp. EC38]